MGQKFLSFEAARKYVHDLKLDSMKAYRQLEADGKIPFNIPVTPSSVYKNKGWVSSKDWIGPTWIDKRGSRNSHNRRNLVTKLSFEEAKKYVRDAGIKNAKEYFFLVRGKIDTLPSNPHTYYLHEGWNGWQDFLGTACQKNSIGKRIKNTSYSSYKEAKKIMKRYHLTTWDDWYRFRSSDARPKTIPSTPEKFYKENGWISMEDFLSTRENTTQHIQKIYAENII